VDVDDTVEPRVTESDWVDRTALDRRGALIGVIVDVYDDPLSRRPAWLAISTGFFGARVGVAPLGSASRLGEDVVIGHDRSTIASAPSVDVVVTVDPSQQRQLIDHYASVPDPPADPSPTMESRAI
jgi:hypothetical protein